MYASLISNHTIKSLRGDHGVVETFDFSHAFVSPDDLIVITKSINRYEKSKGTSNQIVSINFTNNRLCGVDIFGVGDYNIRPFHNFIKLMAPSRYLRMLNLSENAIGLGGCAALADFLQSNVSLNDLMY